MSADRTGVACADSHPHQSPPRIRIASPEGTERSIRHIESQGRPLAPIPLQNLHPAYIPHHAHRVLQAQNHVTFAQQPSIELPRLNTHQVTPNLHHVYQITTLSASPKDRHNTTGFWLPSPHSPDSRRSGLHSYPVPVESSPTRKSQRFPQLLRLRRFLVRLFVEWWMLEILSWCFSAACMTIIIVVLNHYKDGPLPTWPRYLTLNGFISVFSGFARAALLLPTAEALGQLKWNIFRTRARSMLDFERLDMASRGPWGALLLLLQTRRLSLSTIGATIILLSLPVDLFFQQIVHITSIPDNRHPASKSPAATTYLPRDGSSRITGRVSFRPPVDLDAFPRQLFLTNASMPQLKADCPTNNCTWPIYDTLAVCSKCQDMNKLAYFDCLTVPADWLPDGTNTPKAVFPNKTQCGYFVNRVGKPPVLLSGYVKENGTQTVALGQRFLPINDPFLRTPIGNGSFVLDDVQNALHVVAISRTPGGPNGAFLNATPHIDECAFYWCAQTVQTGYNAGGLYETIQQSWPLEPSSPGNPWVAVNATSQPYAYVTNYSLSLPSRQVPGSQNVFRVDNTTTGEALQVFDPISPSFVWSDRPGTDPKMRWLSALQNTPPTTQPFPNDDNPWLPPNNITEHVARIARAMTYAIRNSPGATNGLIWVKGESWTIETVVQVRWEWIALPLTLLGASLLFLVATVVRSSLESEEVGIYKTSALAILFNGLDDDVQQSVGSNPRMDEIREKAREIMVRLAPE